MFKGTVYCARWTYKGKRRKAWGVRYSIDGAKFTRTIVADTKEGADVELDKMREQYRERQRKAQSGLTDGKTFADLITPFLGFKEQLGREMVTIRSKVRNLTPHFGPMLLSQIDATAIDAYVTGRCKEFKMQPCKTHAADTRCPACDQRIDKATVNRDLAVLRNMLKLAVRKWRWLDREPYLEKLPEKPGRDLELSEAEEERLLAVCSPALADLIAGAVHTGMRQGELIGLTWPQVDLAARTIDFAPTKRGRKRLMPINDDLYYILARRKAAAQGMTGPRKTDRVFSRPDGPPWSKGSVEDHFAKALAAAGITKPLVWHDLRHSFASRLKRNGTGETEIQRLLGHKTLAMTDRYITVEIEQMRTAVASLARRSRAEVDAGESRPCRNMTEQTEAGSTLSGNYTE